MTITELKPYEVDDVWPLIEPGLAKVKAKSNPQPEWSPDDVREALRSGFAKMALAYDNAALLGHWTWRIQTRPFTGKRSMFLWTFHAAGQRYEHREPTVEYIRATALAAGADEILMISSRKGFEKFGFQPTMTVYRKDVG